MIKKKLIELINILDFNNCFLIDNNDNKYSYNSFFSNCFFMAKILKKRKEKNVFVVMDNCVELVALFFAVIFANKRIIVADPEKGKDELMELLHGQIDCFAMINKKGVEINEGLFQMPYDYTESNCKRCVINAFEEYDFSESYLTTFTSGTSGKTKGVVHSLDNLFFTAFAFAEKLNNNEKGNFLHLMPMTYMAGILNSIFMPFIMGYCIVVGPRFSVKVAMSFWKTVEKNSINLLWMSPMMLTMIEKVDRNNRYEEYCRQHKISFLIGTAPLPTDIRHRFESRYGVMLQTSYGLSETLFVSLETQSSRNKTNIDNVGEILSGVDYLLKEDGELLLNVPWMFKGYTNEDTSEYFEKGYYITGDLAEIDDGILRIIGRKKDLIIRGGLNISPKLIEDCISEMNAFIEYSVFGRENSFGEEEVCCAYVIGDEKNPIETEKDVCAHIIKRLGRNYSINSFIQMDSLPRNINGKIDKNVLRSM